jgi:hypothetical protein
LHSAFGTKSCALALGKAGIPTLSLEASAMDTRLWDNDAMVKMVATFIETRVQKFSEKALAVGGIVPDSVSNISILS